jgi:hypothetical protein
MMPNRCLENPVFFLPDLTDSLSNLGLCPRPRRGSAPDPGFYPPGMGADANTKGPCKMK